MNRFHVRLLGLSLLGVVAVSGCLIGADIEAQGRSCRSDLDCPDELECVSADSATADRVCMPILEDDSGN